MRRPSQQASDVMHAATPSKNLFSPILRYADGTSATVTEVETETVTPQKPQETQAEATPIASAKNTSSKEVKVTTSTAATPTAAAATTTASQSPSTKTEQANTSANDAQDDDDEDVFNPYLFIANLPPHSSISQKSKICLPPISAAKKHMVTLALDLDETLVHCSIEPIPNPDHIFPVSFNDVLYQVYVRKRPYLDQFLEAIYKNFEVSPIA
jgi:hypothetical protein